MRYKLLIPAALAVLSAASLSLAEIIPKSDAELAKAAKNIVVGTVNGVYKQVSRSGDWEDVNGLVEIAVEKVDSGEGIKPGDVIFARFWNRYWIGKTDPPPYGTGHNLHQNGTTVRAHLTPDKGAYELVLPNGLVAIEKEKPTAAR